MVKASKGIMRKTRQKFRKRAGKRGLSPITRALQQFEEGDKVTVFIDSGVHKGQPHKRFHGLTGKVVEKRGRAYVIDVRFGGKIKKAIALPEHLKRA
jgi:large subunit ribosomal protein L21e